jgi:hypothetical protein
MPDRQDMRDLTPNLRRGKAVGGAGPPMPSAAAAQQKRSSDAQTGIVTLLPESAIRSRLPPISERRAPFIEFFAGGGHGPSRASRVVKTHICGRPQGLHRHRRPLPAARAAGASRTASACGGTNSAS